MISLGKSRNYIAIKNKYELEQAKQCDLCRYIILESGNVIYKWTYLFGKWKRERYVAFGEARENDETVTGVKAYQSFYKHCGKEKVEEMKKVYEPIDIWDGHEQMHYANIDYMQTKIYEDVYEFDANSAFTYGAMQLPEKFEPLKEYMGILYEKKKSAPNKMVRTRYKNMQNYLIGYFARIKEFVKVRSEIIRLSNVNIALRMSEISNAGGKVYLSNTDSIVTDVIGAKVMQDYLGDEYGKFKLERVADRLYYNSCNSYQIGEKIVYSGVRYFARVNTDFFSDTYAEQKGRLIEPYDFEILCGDENYSKLCKVRLGEITVNVVNVFGEIIDTVIYKLRG